MSGQNSSTSSDSMETGSGSFNGTPAALRGVSRYRSVSRVAKKRPPENKDLTDDELQDLRLKVNSRERKRMHDLNSAMDGLRSAMPYATGPTVRKLSKIATLLLAKNYILMLNHTLEETRRAVWDIYPSARLPQLPDLSNLSSPNQTSPQDLVYGNLQIQNQGLLYPNLCLPGGIPMQSTGYVIQHPSVLERNKSNHDFIKSSPSDFQSKQNSKVKVKHSIDRFI